MATSNALKFFVLVLLISWMAGTSAEGKLHSSTGDRKSRQFILLPQSPISRDSSEGSYYHDNPYFPSQSQLAIMPSTVDESVQYLNQARIPSVFNNAGSSPLKYPVATGKMFSGFFASQRPVCPMCPACPPFPTCPTPTCPTPTCPPLNCPPAPTPTILMPTTVAFIPVCTQVTNIGQCTKLTAAPSGNIDVAFTAGQIAAVGIVAYPPNTSIKVTCSSIPVGTAITKINGATIPTTPLPVTVTVSEFAFISVSGAAISDKLTCTWTSSP